MTRYAHLAAAALYSAGLSLTAHAAVEGTVIDSNGRPLAGAMVSAEPIGPGADVVTVFVDEQGRYRFPEDVDAANVAARLAGFEQVDPQATGAIVMRPTQNHADVAPASAWLHDVPDTKRMKMVLDCVNCHQVPTPEVRNYAAAIDAQNAPNPHDARQQSWESIAQYMNLLWSEELNRGAEQAQPVETEHAYSVGDIEGIATILADHFQGPMQALASSDLGAPLAVTPNTSIREYEIGGRNAVREALMLGDPARLWVADVATDRIFAVDVQTGEEEVFDIPADVDVGPHTLHPGPDRSLWVAPFFNGVVAHLDMKSEKWRTWRVKTPEGGLIGIHDLSFGSDHELLADKKGRIWFSDIVNNAVGWFDPDSGEAKIFDAPEVAGRPSAGAQLYGLAMTDDQKYIWYSQLGIGAIGCFNVETEEYETLEVLEHASAGPRRITMGDDGILYVPLYGAGQLLMYDTIKREQIGIYDLPHRGSAPYAVTWDPVRKVVWIPTSNADAIYRFDPATKDFSIIPLPRQRAFLRMIDIDPDTGVLVSSYANIIEHVQGPRMALIVDPGDGAYKAKEVAAR